MQQVWSFKTRNFQVDLMISPCEIDPEDSLEFPEDVELVRSGQVEWFDASVAVKHLPTGIELGSDHLGCCSYYDFESFFEGHRDKDPMNRNCSIMREAKGSNVVICHYFPSMVRESISAARINLDLIKNIC